MPYIDVATPALVPRAQLTEMQTGAFIRLARNALQRPNASIDAGLTRWFLVGKRGDGLATLRTVARRVYRNG